MSNPPPAPAPDVALLTRAVLRLGRRLRAERPFSAPAGPSITLSSLGLLATLHREGPMPAARLAEAERLQPQSLSRLIPRLEADGLLRRTVGRTDRRTLVLAVTAAGRRAVRDDIAARRAWLERAMGESLSKPERERLREAAELMLRLAESHPSSATAPPP